MSILRTFSRNGISCLRLALNWEQQRISRIPNFMLQKSLKFVEIVQSAHYSINYSQDHYKVLQIPVDASLDDIQEAYGILTQQYNPMTHPDTAEAIQQMKRINEAYRVLSSFERRQKYDLAIGLLERKSRNTGNKTKEEYESERVAAYDFNNPKNRAHNELNDNSQQNQRIIIEQAKDDMDDEHSLMQRNRTLSYIFGVILIIYCLCEVYLFIERKQYEKNRRKYAEEKKNL